MTRRTACFASYVLGSAVASFLWSWVSYETRTRAEAAAFERGIAFGMEIATAAEPAAECPVASLPPELTAGSECRATLADYRRTEAANRANAHELGKDEGLRLGREDWYACGQWESR